MPNTAARNIIHVVAGIIRDPLDPSKILITRRKQGTHLENLWEFPGGKVEPGESRFFALKRELEEETGIHVVSAMPFQSVHHRYKEKNIFLDVWEIKQYWGQASGVEGQDANWVNIHELANYEFPDADKPVLKALSLYPRLLVTPDMPEQFEQSFIDQFERLMERQPYPLVVFRSHHLDDKTYADVAKKLNRICQNDDSHLIVHRPSLKSLQSKLLDAFQWRHLNSYSLQSIIENPFHDEVKLSASCHDKAELKMAQRLDCEFALLSTVRDTQSHPGRQAKGWSGIKSIISKVNIPVYALGGVRRKDLCNARFQGAIGVAGITDFWSI
jgi:8-oxo-dGTP diphosphatase